MAQHSLCVRPEALREVLDRMMDCNIITCEDTGGGIRPDLIDRIYERGVSSKGENRGTGLFLIKQLVEESHGDISIETEEGEGTCFTITFTGKEKPSCTM